MKSTNSLKKLLASIGAGLAFTLTTSAQQADSISQSTSQPISQSQIIQQQSHTIDSTLEPTSSIQKDSIFIGPYAYHVSEIDQAQETINKVVDIAENRKEKITNLQQTISNLQKEVEKDTIPQDIEAFISTYSSELDKAYNTIEDLQVDTATLHYTIARQNAQLKVNNAKIELLQTSLENEPNTNTGYLEEQKRLYQENKQLLKEKDSLNTVLTTSKDQADLARKKISQLEAQIQGLETNSPQKWQELIASQEQELNEIKAVQSSLLEFEEYKQELFNSYKEKLTQERKKIAVAQETAQYHKERSDAKKDVYVARVQAEQSKTNIQAQRADKEKQRAHEAENLFIQFHSDSDTIDYKAQSVHLENKNKQLQQSIAYLQDSIAKLHKMQEQDIVAQQQTQPQKQQTTQATQTDYKKELYTNIKNFKSEQQQLTNDVKGFSTNILIESEITKNETCDNQVFDLGKLLNEYATTVQAQEQQQISNIIQAYEKENTNQKDWKKASNAFNTFANSYIKEKKEAVEVLREIHTITSENTHKDNCSTKVSYMNKEIKNFKKEQDDVGSILVKTLSSYKK